LIRAVHIEEHGRIEVHVLRFIGLVFDDVDEVDAVVFVVDVLEFDRPVTDLLGILGSGALSDPCLFVSIPIDRRGSGTNPCMAISYSFLKF